METKKTSWLDSFDETCQDILEDAFLLDALSMYLFSGGEFTSGERADCFPYVFRRLCGYLSQHAMDLQGLRKRTGPDL
jgi:hypothetical protein